ncbi:MAG: tetratricopeptide repeat protein [Candidatus Peribacteraceae bacterium]|nr:tetratricopeptide repeat protein [Candidatus Peribacteraceae bacterium]
MSLRYYFAVILAFGAIALLVYGASLGNEFIAFDDDTLVYDNPAIQELSLSSVAWIFTHFDPELYIPLTSFSYQIDHAIAGMNPTQFSVHNLLLHILNAVLVVAILSRMTVQRKWSLFAGLLFLIHPLHTEAVVWIASRKDLLSTFFFLLSVGTYLLFVGQPKRQRFLWYGLSVLAFGLGLLSKVSIVLLPLVLLLIDYWNKRSLSRRLVFDKIPFFCLSAIFGCVAVLGKEDVLGDSSFIQGVLMAARSTAFYLQKFFVPTSLSLVYPHLGPVTLLDMHFAVSVLVIIALSIAVTVARSRKIWAAVGIGFCTIFPSFFNYAKGGDLYFASDRYAYLPSVALLLILVFLLQRIRLDRRVTITCAVIIALFSYTAHRQSLHWKNTNTLFSHVIDLYEETYFAHTKVATYLINEGDHETARSHLERSLAIKPTGRAYYNLGILALKEEQNDAALGFFEQAVEVHEGLPYAHMNLGYLYYLRGDMELAIQNAEQAVLLAPEDQDIAQNLAGIYKAAGRIEDAERIFDRIRIEGR